MNDTPATIGHNQPPMTTADDLASRFRELAIKAEEFSREVVPPSAIKDDIHHAAVVEAGKKCRAIERALEDARDAERAPLKLKTEEINGWFNTRIEALESIRKKLTSLHKDYSEKKAAAEKKRLAEEAEKKRFAEAEALRLAQDASRTKADAESARRNAEALAEIASSARDVATTAVQIAQADAAEARSEIAKIRLRIAEIDAEFAQRRRDKDESATDENRRAARADLDAALSAAQEKAKGCDAIVASKKAEAEEAKRQQRLAEETAAAAARDLRAAAREEKFALDEAVRHDKAATRIEERAQGSEADLARVRSEHGAVGTVARQWVCEVIDRDALDKNALWPFINGEAIQSALWKWMMAQPQDKRVMRGARMEQEIVGQVR